MCQLIYPNCDKQMRNYIALSSNDFKILMYEMINTNEMVKNIVEMSLYTS